MSKIRLCGLGWLGLGRARLGLAGLGLARLAGAGLDRPDRACWGGAGLRGALFTDVRALLLSGHHIELAQTN